MPQDVDTLKMSYMVHISHSACVSPEAFYCFIVPSSSGFKFNPTVYFHPNVHVDGWVQLHALHQVAKQKHDMMMDRKEEVDKQNREKEELRKAKEKGKERETGSEEQEGDGEGLKKAKPFVRVNFPDFPSTPRFWDHPVQGSTIGLWPLCFFNDWIEDVSNGKELCLDPVPGNIAGPSGHQQPPDPPSPPPNTTSRPNQPLPSPPANTTPPAGPTGTEDEYDTFDLLFFIAILSLQNYVLMLLLLISYMYIVLFSLRYMWSLCFFLFLFSYLPENKNNVLYH